MRKLERIQRDRSDAVALAESVFKGRDVQPQEVKDWIDAYCDLIRPKDRPTPKEMLDYPSAL